MLANKMEKMILSKSIPSQITKLNFIKDLDCAIIPMKRNLDQEYNEVEIEQLKCCFLFLGGMSFFQISNRLEIPIEKVSQLLNDKQLESLLSNIYQVLFQMNQHRLTLEKERSKVKFAVKTFIEQNGDYQKTEMITGFSASILIQYFENPSLEEILENSECYHAFIKIYRSPISVIETSETKENEPLKQIISQLEPHNIIEKRYCSLCEAILVYHIYDMKRLKRFTKMSETNIRKYLTDFSRCETFLPEEVLEALKAFMRKQKLDLKKTDENFNKEYQLAVIQLYMKGRYSYMEMAEICNSTTYMITEILNVASKSLLTPQEYEKLIQHKKSIDHLKRSFTKKEAVRDYRMIELVKPEIIFVDNLEYQLLSVLVNFIEVYQSINREELKESLLSMITFLSAKKETLEKILRESFFHQIQATLHIEQLLLENQLQEKYNVIQLAVNTFFEQKLDLDNTAFLLHMSTASLIRVLQDDFVKKSYGIIAYEYMNQAISNYRIEKQKEESQKKFQFVK